ncbi:pentatricopeptide repeat domain-containing [Trichoderma arundinaceum]|uniref:Pentatricopeptide repeat domain-containing n=1 Tax=Trichoderma arundinaceum TaxID=490622 RepID=A0A395NUN9_TRIAR|nr:pentatricopeptide repeat domain-containing [Trichoderma arundinaceum]
MHGSRRAANLQPSDYDHEITILDDEEAQSLRATSSEGGELVATNTSTRLLSDREAETEDDQERPSDRGVRDGGSIRPSASKGKGGETQIYQLNTSETTSDFGPSRSGARPSIEIRAPSLEAVSERASTWDNRSRPRSREKRETAIDILYENERGGFLCGVALFSGAALGGLDPTPWTNAYHNPSPTDIHTAQVPDPSWEWVWPDWRINEQEGLDEGGWEYSFAFQKQFSWHGPRWWNSFVRRRAWIRKRAKKRPEDIPAGSNMLAGVDYFHIRPASVLSPPGSLAGSRAPSRAPSRTSMTQASSAEAEQGRPDIEDIHMLLQVLRSARIDRERREAVENYIEHAVDLSELEHEMHEIMSLFIFQQSRRQLLSYLMHKHDETAKAWGEDRGLELKLRKEALDAAVKHAEEEVCKLAYWSDVKQMAESGELRDVVDASEVLGPATSWRFASSAALTDKPAAAESQDASIEAETRLSTSPTSPAKPARPNNARNRMFRQAFREKNQERLEDVQRKLTSPYVPTMRDYPSAHAAKESKIHALQVARVQVAFDMIWGHFGHGMPNWSETFNLLKRMMTKRSEPSSMAAMRIVLPKSWELELGSKKIEFVSSTTGLLTKLRVSSDHQNPSAIILRGKSSVLANAADELVAACKDVEVYRLGEVAAFGYEVKRLWPAIEDAADGGSFIPEDKLDNIWVHQEHQTYWIDTPYEQTSRPKEWTLESLDSYITTLVCGRLRPHLALRYYAKPEKDGAFVDTDGIRIKLIMDALTDPEAKACITPSVLKMAMSFMAHKGGHRADADRLLTLAEEWGMPLDTEVFNIMLEGYVTKRDVAFFHKLLLKMEQRYFHPNARTWLLFLELVEKEMERRQVIVAMYDLGLFQDPATRRGIARIMATHDAYVAFKSGKRLSAFMAEQKSRYGDDWFTTDAMNSILTEFFRFHERDSRRFDDFRSLIEKQSEDGRKVGADTINLVLERCLAYKDWDTAMWALTKLHESGCEADALTYQYVIRLAIRLQLPHALGVAVFSAALEYKLRDLTRVILRRHLVDHVKDTFWLQHKPKMLSKEMGHLLMNNKAKGVSKIVSRLEWAINHVCKDYKPAKSLAEMLDLAQRTKDRPLLLRHRYPQDFQYEGADAPSEDLAIKMVSETAGGRATNVRLSWRFDAKTMVRGWNEEKEKKSQEWLDLNRRKSDVVEGKP